MDITVSSIEGLDVVVDALVSFMEDGYNVFLLSGELGSGKTTLVKAFCDKMGVKSAVGSPTFSLINEYPSPAAGMVYHMDLYRIEKPEDLQQVGLDEYLHSGRVCFIEWPEIAIHYFTMSHVRVKIDVETNNIRIFNITTHDAMDA